LDEGDVLPPHVSLRRRGIAERHRAKGAGNFGGLGRPPKALVGFTVSLEKRLVFEGGLAPPTLKPTSVGNHGDVVCSTISSALTGCQPIVKVYIFLSFSSSVPNLPDETKFDGEEREKKPSTRAPAIFFYLFLTLRAMGK
jgi:hypothetical protein